MVYLYINHKKPFSLVLICSLSPNTFRIKGGYQHGEKMEKVPSMFISFGFGDKVALVVDGLGLTV